MPDGILVDRATTQSGLPETRQLLGAVLSGLLVTWIVVASQATQFAF